MAAIQIYTCVVGGYERTLYTPARQSREVTFTCFTDSPLRNTRGWELRPLAGPAELKRPDHISKYHKFFPHRVLPEAQISIWVDANVRIIGDLMPLVDQLEQAGAAFSVSRHAERDSYRDEMAVCVRTKRIRGADVARAAAQIDYYQSEGLPEVGLQASGLLVRRHDADRLTAAMDLWWDQVTRFSARDQISLPFVLWRSGLNWIPFDFVMLRPNVYIARHPHGARNLPHAMLRTAWYRLSRRLPHGVLRKAWYQLGRRLR